MKNMTIKQQLYALIILVIVAFSALGGVAIWKLGVTNSSAKDMSDNAIPSLNDVNAVNTNVTEFRTYLADYLLAEGDEQRTKALNDIKDVDTSIQQHLADYKQYIGSEHEQKTYDALVAGWPELKAIGMKAVEAGAGPGAEIYANEFDKKFDEVGDIPDQLIKINMDIVSNASSTAQQTYEHTRMIMIGLVLGMGALVSMVALGVAKGINRGMSELQRSINNLANLDLRTRAKVENQNEIGKTLDQFNKTATELTGVVRSTQDAAQTVSAAAHELSAGMESISATTHEQEASLTSIAASLEETSVSASEVNSKAQRSGQATEDIVNAIGGVVTNVSELSTSASAIGTVLEVIKGISEQINLLSLNAAIEAARAGDAGRGFAVVADEVRKLAGSTSASTDEIAKVVSDLQGSVQKTKQALDGVGGALDEVKSNSASVVSAVGQQTIAVNTISQSIGEFRTQMASVMHNVQEAQVASESLSQSAEELNTQTGRFKV